MSFQSIDGYLLDGRPAKAEAIASALADRSRLPAAAPFYRALEVVGVRAADESLIALRLVLAGRTADDDAIRRVRAILARVRAGESDARAAYASEMG
jgi:ribose 1,5-bisphosphokinase PhnN